jgi:hypothetical protein
MSLLDNFPFSIRNMIIHILEFFDRNGSPSESSSTYFKEAFKIYQAIRNPSEVKTFEIIEQLWKNLEKVPLTYGDIRALYG